MTTYEKILEDAQYRVRDAEARVRLAYGYLYDAKVNLAQIESAPEKAEELKEKCERLIEEDND